MQRSIEEVAGQMTHEELLNLLQYTMDSNTNSAFLQQQLQQQQLQQHQQMQHSMGGQQLTPQQQQQAQQLQQAAQLQAQQQQATQQQMDPSLYQAQQQAGGFTHFHVQQNRSGQMAQASPQQQQQQQSPQQQQQQQQAGTSFGHHMQPGTPVVGSPNVQSQGTPQQPGTPSGSMSGYIPAAPQQLSIPEINTQLPETVTKIFSEPLAVQAQALLDDLIHLQRQYKEVLEKIRAVQKVVMRNPQKSTFDLLNTQHRQLKGLLDTELKALHTLSCTRILFPNETHQQLHATQELQVMQTQLELYHQELQQLTLPHPTRCIATLVVANQSFPIVVTKGKQLDEDPVVVQLLSGANVEFQSFSRMQAAIVWEAHQGKSASSSNKNIEQESQPLDTFRRSAKWHLKFLNGTRKNMVSLKFGMQVQVTQGTSSATVTVESPHTKPFIVITNECQWEEAEGALIKAEAFAEQSEVEWFSFANLLQRHFLRATRQNPMRPTRCLNLEDFDYIHKKFFGGHAFVGPKAFDAFWEWFGKAAKKLRYQRHVLPLWQAGLIHGFRSREEIHQLLRHQRVGTFIVRFSERHPGLFAIAYIVNDPSDPIRHYLVMPEDTSGNKKTFPDFLSQQVAFSYMLQIATTNEEGQVQHRHFLKDAVLEPYLSKRSTTAPATGYDRTVLNSVSESLDMDQDILDAE